METLSVPNLLGNRRNFFSLMSHRWLYRWLLSVCCHQNYLVTTVERLHLVSLRSFNTTGKIGLLPNTRSRWYLIWVDFWCTKHILKIVSRFFIHLVLNLVVKILGKLTLFLLIFWFPSTATFHYLDCRFIIGLCYRHFSHWTFCTRPEATTVVSDGCIASVGNAFIIIG